MARSSVIEPGLPGYGAAARTLIDVLLAEPPPVVALADSADPVRWMERRLGAFLWSVQREIAAAVRDHRRVAVHSCFESARAGSPPAWSPGGSTRTRPVRPSW
jgi:hypothetical protein